MKTSIVFLGRIFAACVSIAGALLAVSCDQLPQTGPGLDGTVRITLPDAAAGRAVNREIAMELVEFYEVLVYSEYNDPVTATGRPGQTLSIEVPTGIWAVLVLGGVPDDGGYSLLASGSARTEVLYGRTNSVTVTLTPISYELYIDGQINNGWTGFSGSVALNTGQLYFTAEEFEMNTDAEPASVTVNGEGNGAEFEGGAVGWPHLGPVPLYFTGEDVEITVPCRWHLGCSPSREQDGLWRAMNGATEDGTVAPLQVAVQWGS